MIATDSLVEISSEAELRELLGYPVGRAVTKERMRLHERDRDWLAASPFCLVATSGADGTCDVSPKGDPPGFTLVLDDTTLAIPERPGDPESGHPAPYGGLGRRTAKTRGDDKWLTPGMCST